MENHPGTRPGGVGHESPDTQALAKLVPEANNSNSTSV
jgi:hypothetical protein